MVYQKDNNRGAVITGYKGSLGKVALVVIDTNDQKHKKADLLNGYIGGQYNVLVTAYNLNDLKQYLDNENNIVLRDKKNGISRGRSGSLVPSLSNDTPFFNDSISDNLQNSNPSEEKSYHRTSTKENTPAYAELKSMLRVYAEDGRGMYEGIFPKGTPKTEKAEVILNYIQNVWSKKPIRLVLNRNGTERVIYAKFDPTYSSEEGVETDARKLMGGNRMGRPQTKE